MTDEIRLYIMAWFMGHSVQPDLSRFPVASIIRTFREENSSLFLALQHFTLYKFDNFFAEYIHKEKSFG